MLWEFIVTVGHGHILCLANQEEEISIYIYIYSFDNTFFKAIYSGGI